VVVTRVDQCDAVQLEQIEARIRRVHPKVPIVRAVHQPAGVFDLEGRGVELPSSSRVGCFAGIARPDAFLRTLQDAGHHVAETFWLPDHHDYGADDVAALRKWAHDQRLDVLLTTEKDAVKLRAVEAEWSVLVAVMRVDMTLLDDGERVLAGLIDEMLMEYEDDDESIEESEEEPSETD
jgi:tetraacyldisaccharide 4'-kinase